MECGIVRRNNELQQLYGGPGILFITNRQDKTQRMPDRRIVKEICQRRPGGKGQENMADIRH